MSGVKYDEMQVQWVRDRVERRIACSDNLMMTIMDFNDGPQTQPDPPHSHPHEQVTYVAEGEILFLIDEQSTRLSAGDIFIVPSGKPHTIQLLSDHARLIDCFTPLREDFLPDPIQYP